MGETRIIESRTYEIPGLHDPDTIRSQHVITSVRVEQTIGHDRVHVWNRGGHAGTLVVDSGDGDVIARILTAARTRGEQIMQRERNAS